MSAGAKKGIYILTGVGSSSNVMYSLGIQPSSRAKVSSIATIVVVSALLWGALYSPMH